MISSSKPQKTTPTFKYSVLRPYPKILALARSFRRTACQENYQLAVEHDFGVRRYQIRVDSFQQTLREAQWRYNCLSPVVRCLYVELLQPGPMRSSDVEMYISHLEVVLGDLRQLLLQEAIYLIIQSLKGYETLLEYYQKVSVNDHTIGIGSNGQCFTWINRFLEKPHCEDNFLTSPFQIIQTILKLTKERSEPVSRKFIAKVEEYVEVKRPNFREALDILKWFASKNGVKVPKNLKYLLHQHRIKQSFSQLQSLKVSTRNFENPTQKSADISIVVKSPKFLKNLAHRGSQRPVSKDLARLCAPSDFKKLRKYSAAEPNTNIDLRKTIESPLPLLTSVSLSQQPSMKTWSWKQSEKNVDGDKNIRSTFQGEDYQKPTKVRSSKSAFPMKSNSSDDICRNLLKPRDDNVIQTLKRCSGMSQNTRAQNSFINRSNHSNDSQISLQVETVKKIGRKSSIQLNDPISIARESLLTSTYPILQYSNENSQSMSPLNSLDPTFHCIPDRLGQDHIKETVCQNNNWTKTFKNLFNNTDGNLNTSISDGQQEICTYLSDVKLQKLDTLSKQMVESLQPEDSEREIKLNDSLNC